MTQEHMQPAWPQAKPRIIVVEDNSDRIRDIKRHLQPIAEELLVFTSYEQVVARPEEFYCQVLFLDYCLLGRETGLEVATWMLDKVPSDKWPDLVIVHTNHISGGSEVAGLLRSNGLKVLRDPYIYGKPKDWVDDILNGV